MIALLDPRLWYALAVAAIGGIALAGAVVIDAVLDWRRQ